MKCTDGSIIFHGEIKITHDRLSSDNRLAATILDTIGAVVCVMDMEGRIILFNKASQDLTGYKESDVINRCPWDLFILQDEVDGVKKVFRELTLGHFPNQYVNYWLTKSGEKRLISWSNTALGDENNQLAYIIATGIDVTDKIQAEEQIAQNHRELEKLIAIRTAELNDANHKLELMAYQDVVTGLYNRRFFNKVLEREIRRARRYRQPLSLLIGDVDFFKDYNDTYGHLAGDVCLKKIADLFRQHFQRASDLVARYGGEEFCVILPNMDSDAARVLSENFLQLVWAANITHDTSTIANRITVSIGLATCSEHDNCNAEILIKAADSALYAAKKSGRNRLELKNVKSLVDA